MNGMLGSLIILLLVSSPAMAKPSCPRVVGEVASCLAFLRKNGPAKPSQRCCQGVKKVNGMAKTRNDRIAICECIKGTLVNIDYDPKRVPVLGKQCGSTFDLPPVDRKTNCNQIA